MIGRATKDLAFFDGKVAPNTEYSYRVKPGSDTVKPDSVEYSNVVTATAMDIWKISFTGAVAGRAEGDRPTVSVTIMKYDSKSGWVEMTHIHQEGDRIGTWAGADVVSFKVIGIAFGLPFLVEMRKYLDLGKR